MMLWSFVQYASPRALLLTVLCVMLLQSTTAQVRTSPSYQLQSDSVNVGGGFSASASYESESTMGEIATGRSTSTVFGMLAGFQQMQASFISMSVPDNVSLTPELPGITGGTSTGSTTVTVISDSPGGYQLSIVASQAPAMQTGFATIPDYVPVGSVPDFTFIVPDMGAALGFSPAGVDRALRYRSSLGVCGEGADDIAERCWDGLSTTPRVIATGAGGNQPNGATTTIYFQVGIGSGAVVVPGSYVATTTLSALSL
jgi:hypothetical protein